ncbi:phage baseplate assembly protein V [Nitrococcus mobilis]|uniref:Gp5/Type VI secretion system Vgr protein OB-fold domain-containing protein n=1 Tax=Nitrococcus mobilis Nb-231 TaxID=314278 RepID=A4BR09_9GAMM|nr:phage baseplate assembly protein V [Nitrococcus mobilis]EAR22009.1 hypothetical protein NB231_06461 [Nitrococcus mobilis Nb-231]
MISDFQPDGGGPRYYGLYPGIVTDIEDPQKLGRVQVKFPWLGSDGEKAVRAWATLLSPYADNDQGLQILPEKDSQVVVGFEAGDLRRPYVVGAAWNGREKQPATPQAANNRRLIKTRAGSVLEFDDASGAAKLTLKMASGHTLALSDADQSVTLTHANGCTVTFNAAGQVEIRANATVEVNAPVLNVHAAAANFDGIVTCTTLNASAAITSPVYSPGAGNIW